MFKYWLYRGLYRVEIIIFMFVKLQWNILGRTSMEYRCFSEARTFLRSRSKRITEFLLCFPRGSRVEIESDSLVLPVFLWYPRAAKMPSIQQFTGYLPQGGIVLPPKATLTILRWRLSFPYFCPAFQMLDCLSVIGNITSTHRPLTWLCLSSSSWCLLSSLLPWCSHAASSLENCTCYLGNSNSTVGTQ